MECAVYLVLGLTRIEGGLSRIAAEGGSAPRFEVETASPDPNQIAVASQPGISRKANWPRGPTPAWQRSSDQQSSRAHHSLTRSTSKLLHPPISYTKKLKARISIPRLTPA